MALTLSVVFLGSLCSLILIGKVFKNEKAINENLKALKINGIIPTHETVQNGTYTPLSRPIFIYVNKKSYTEKPQVKAFVDFYMQTAGEIVPEVGYIALKDYAKEIAKLVK